MFLSVILCKWKLLCEVQSSVTIDLDLDLGQPESRESVKIPANAEIGKA